MLGTQLQNRVLVAQAIGRRHGARCPSHAPGSVTLPSTASCSVRSQAMATAAPPVSSAVVDDDEFLNSLRPARVLVAGGGIAGLVLAVALLKKGIDVRVFERDMTAIRGEGKYRGPIQVQSNALAALEAIDADLAAEVMAEGCITGDRVNGLCDGVTGDWYVKFDTFHPAVNSGLPVTRVISRVTLQQILAKYIEKIGGENVIQPDRKVVSFKEDDVRGHSRVWAELEDGERVWGDVLIGADGIWSKVRTQLIGKTDATYSDYTCYTGISDFVCYDIDTVAYRVFLGNGQYFVSSDVGGGKMQWYAFHKEAPGGSDPPGTQKQRLMNIFGHWNDMVTDLIAATPEDDIIRRDIYDRPPIFKWTSGRVALLGDSAHAMQPNLGQGGCMAIEDAYALACLFSDAQGRDGQTCLSIPYERVLTRYQRERQFRASVIHGMARMAALAASTYKAYLGEGVPAIARFKIPHYGKVMGQLVLGVFMPIMLGWVLGGNRGAIKSDDRPAYCSLTDRPRGFREEDWPRLMRDDEALLSAAHADFVLLPLQDGKEACTSRAMAVSDKLIVGRSADADLCIDDPSIAPQHAHFVEQDGAYYLVADEGGSSSTRLNGKLAARRAQLHPGDVISFGDGDSGRSQQFKVKLMHPSQRQLGIASPQDDGSLRRVEVCFTQK